MVEAIPLRQDPETNRIDGDEQKRVPNTYEQRALLCQILVVFTISMDMTILTPTLPTVAHALGASASQAFWIASSYLLANAVCQPVMAGLADIFGRSQMLFGSVGLFTLGSIICGSASSVPTMLAGRVVQGIGGGGVLSVNLIILSHSVSMRERPKQQGRQQLGFALGTNLAPILGGAIVRGDWHWIFWINLPICAFSLVVIWRFAEELNHSRGQSPARVQDNSGQEPQPLTPPPSGTPSIWQNIIIKLTAVDWFESLLIIAGLTLSLVGLSLGGNPYPWDSGRVLGPIISGIFCLCIAVRYEMRKMDKVFLRFSIFFGHGTIFLALMCTLLQGLILFAMTYYLVIYLMASKLYSPLRAGISILPFGLTVVPVSGLTGHVITRYRKYTWPIRMGWILTIVSSALLLPLLKANTHVAGWVFMFMCAGAGQGILLVAHASLIQAECASADAAHAGSMYSFMRSLGLCLGVVIGGTMFQNLLRIRLKEGGLPVIIADNAEGYISILQAMADDAQGKLAIRQAYAWAISWLFLLTLVIGVVGLICSLCFSQKSMLEGIAAQENRYETDVGDRK